MVLVSAIITTCKREVPYLKRAVDSILNQDYSNMELIIIDDSPDDYEKRNEVKDYCQKLMDENSNVRYVQNEKQSGACASRNKGAHMANGKYVGYLDDDDEWMSNKISTQIQKFTNDEIGLVYCDTLFYNQLQDKSNQQSDKSKFISGSVYKEIMLGNFIGSTSNPLIDKEKLFKIGGFDKDQPAMQDWDVWIRMAEKYPVEFVPECLLKYYIHGNGHISSNPDKRIAGLKRLNNKQEDYLNKHKDNLAMRYHYLMRLYVSKQDIKSSIKYYCLSVTCQPLSVGKNIHKLKSFGRLFIRTKDGSWN